MSLIKTTMRTELGLVLGLVSLAVAVITYFLHAQTTTQALEITNGLVMILLLGSYFILTRAENPNLPMFITTQELKKGLMFLIVMLFLNLIIIVISMTLRHVYRNFSLLRDMDLVPLCIIGVLNIAWIGSPIFKKFYQNSFLKKCVNVAMIIPDKLLVNRLMSEDKLLINLGILLLTASVVGMIVVWIIQAIS